MSPNEALKKAVDLAGGQEALARKVTVLAHHSGALEKPKSLKQQNVYNWMNREGKCPGKWVIFVSNAVDGCVSFHELRPDLYPVSLTA